MKVSVRNDDGIVDVTNFKGADDDAKAKSGRNFDHAITGILVLSVVLIGGVVEESQDGIYMPILIGVNAIVIVLSSVALGSLDREVNKGSSVIACLVVSVLGLIFSAYVHRARVVSDAAWEKEYC